MLISSGAPRAELSVSPGASQTLAAFNFITMNAKRFSNDKWLIVKERHKSQLPSTDKAELGYCHSQGKQALPFSPAESLVLKLGYKYCMPIRWCGALKEDSEIMLSPCCWET